MKLTPEAIHERPVTLAVRHGNPSRRPAVQHQGSFRGRAFVISAWTRRGARA